MNTPLEELKHSIKIHLTIFGGATAQLSVYLIKLIDFLEDTNVDRRRAEMLSLTFSVVEAAALRVNQSIITKSTQPNFPPALRKQNDDLIFSIGANRNLSDKVVAKYAVLKEMSGALKLLSSYTGTNYPDITTAAGNVI